MGKGDKRTKRGKIFSHSFGKYRMKLNKLQRKKRKQKEVNSENS